MFKIWLRVSIILILLMGSGVVYLQKDTLFPAAASTTAAGFTQVVAVQQGSIAATISVVGQLDAPQNQDMAFNGLSGTTPLLNVLVKVGEVVQAGQVLATIDPTPYEQALEQAQSNLETAQTDLTDLLTPPTNLAFSQADLAVAQADLAYAQAQDALNTLLSPDLAALQSKVSSAQLNLTQAQADLVILQSDTSFADTLSKLNDTESQLAGDYGRLTQETYSDAFYLDRVNLAKNRWLDAQDTRINAETQQQVKMLNGQNSVTQAQQSLTSTRTALFNAQTAADELSIAKTKQAVAKAGVDLAQAKSDRVDLAAGPDPAALTTAQNTVTKAEQAVSDAQTALASTSLAAPFAGTILQTNNVAGDRITASSVILTLANLNQLQVVAAIDETTIRQVQAGQSAEISFDAFPGQSFMGQVISVPLQGTLQGGIMVYDVPISLEGAEQLPLLVGMTANAVVSVGQADNALLLPSIAVQSSRGGYQVLVPNPSDPTAQPQALPVEVGLTNGIYTQITNGLNVGEQVLVELSTATTANNAFTGGNNNGSINNATRLLNGR